MEDSQKFDTHHKKNSDAPLPKNDPASMG